MLKVHPIRSCLYDEAARCIEINKAHKDIVNHQVSLYRASGIPARRGLYETGFMVRENTEKANAVADAWWHEVEKHSHRDQIALPAVLHQLQYTPTKVPASVMNSFIKINKHSTEGRPWWVFERKEQSPAAPEPAPTKPRIWYLTPFSSEKNIGGEYNSQIALLP